ncbi:MAG TPA: HAMP domain-containing sensor histidine kinase [Thermoleophilaceae bacterium]|nr:HAMP domain-containing sensor histidine kinase [Thermoleophilaceae bacterium]
MTWRGLALALFAAAGAAGIALALYGDHAGRETLEILLPLGLVTVLGARLLVLQRERAGGLRRQVLLSVALVLGQLLVAVGLFAWLMLVSHMDVLFTLMVVAYSCLLGLWAARALGARVLSDLEAVRSGLADVGRGERSVKIKTGARDELAGLALDVERMVERLSNEEQARSAADHARRDLLAAVSHDLRTPLASIQVLAEAIEDRVVDDRTRREYAARMAVHVRALSGLIDDLFELSRLEAGDIRWTMEQVKVAELVEETVDAMRPEAEAEGVAVRTELGYPNTYARANPERIQRVLFNLIQNAIRHTPADGSVTVRAEQLNGAVEIEVADTGSGIGQEDRACIFDAFVQGSSDRSRTNGSAGLGLAIARAIVEAHGGRIWLADAPAGTVVRFSLPRG